MTTKPWDRDGVFDFLFGIIGGMDWPTASEQESIAAALNAREAALVAELAEAKERELDTDAQCVAVWNYLQKVSPWTESNDMLWADEIITGIDMLVAEVEGLRADAERYRWLRMSCWYVGPEPDGDTEGVSLYDRNLGALDTAIDAARGGE